MFALRILLLMAVGASSSTLVQGFGEPKPAKTRPPTTQATKQPTAGAEQQCATEDGQCSCPGGKVKFGAGNTWTPWQHVDAGNTSIACTTAVFGDPIDGVRKVCMCGVVATTYTLSRTRKNSYCSADWTDDAECRSAGGTCFPSETIQACQSACSLDSGCNGVSFDPHRNWCLKCAIAHIGNDATSTKAIDHWQTFWKTGNTMSCTGSHLACQRAAHSKSQSRCAAYSRFGCTWGSVPTLSPTVLCGALPAGKLFSNGKNANSNCATNCDTNVGGCFDDIKCGALPAGKVFRSGKNASSACNTNCGTDFGGCFDGCTDQADFTDSYGSCATYAQNKWCEGGGSGSSWEKTWGAIPPATTTACCACGGGVRGALTKPGGFAYAFGINQTTGGNGMECPADLGLSPTQTEDHCSNAVKQLQVDDTDVTPIPAANSHSYPRGCFVTSTAPQSRGSAMFAASGDNNFKFSASQHYTALCQKGSISPTTAPTTAIPTASAAPTAPTPSPTKACVDDAAWVSEQGVGCTVLNFFPKALRKRHCAAKGKAIGQGNRSTVIGKVACFKACGGCDACYSEPCLHHGTCAPLRSSRTKYKCTCTSRWEGTRCQENIARKKNLAKSLANAKGGCSLQKGMQDFANMFDHSGGGRLIGEMTRYMVPFVKTYDFDFVCDHLYNKTSLKEPVCGSKIVTGHSLYKTTMIKCPNGVTGTYVVMQLCAKPCLQEDSSVCCFVPEIFAKFFSCCRELRCCPDQMGRRMQNRAAQGGVGIAISVTVAVNVEEGSAAETVFEHMMRCMDARAPSASCTDVCARAGVCRTATSS